MLFLIWTGEYEDRQIIASFDCDESTDFELLERQFKAETEYDRPSPRKWAVRLSLEYGFLTQDDLMEKHPKAPKGTAQLFAYWLENICGLKQGEYSEYHID